MNRPVSGPKKPKPKKKPAKYKPPGWKPAKRPAKFAVPEVLVDVPRDLEGQVEFTKKVLLAVVDDQERLRRGMQLRDQMHADMMRGVEPKGYRAEWLSVAIDDVIYAAGQRAEAFNVVHPDDKISAFDILDVLVSSVNTWKSHCGLE